jgi:hypothetical protein
MKRKSKWEWYAVKILFESIISGEPTPEKIDKNYSKTLKTFEESIIIVKAQSFDHAYKIVEKKAKDNEHDYINPYDEKVEWRFVDFLDCFSLFDENINSGTEVYSRFIQVPIEMKTEEVMNKFFPDSISEDENAPDYKFQLRVREFNKIPNSE